MPLNKSLRLEGIPKGDGHQRPYYSMGGKERPAATPPSGWMTGRRPAGGTACALSVTKGDKSCLVRCFLAGEKGRPGAIYECPERPTYLPGG